MTSDWLPNLTPAAARALEAAQDQARRCGAGEVRPEHVFHTLLEEEKGSAATILVKAGVDLGALGTVRANASSKGDRGADACSPAPPNSFLPLSSKTQDILLRARELAAEDSTDRTVASEHLLLAMLQEDETLRRNLERFGLSLMRLEAVIQVDERLQIDEPLQLSEPAEQIDESRILDAAANRAREAMRVIEDYCRFVLDDTFLSGELKQLRHDLADALSALPFPLLLESRETLRDVGTGLSTSREGQRHLLQDVVLANWKRLQEALRSLEEFGKLKSPALGEALEKLRYRSYTLEKGLVLGGIARQRLAEVRLCVLVSGSLCAAALDWTIQEAAAGGACMIQLREKSLEDRELLELARQVRRWTKQAGVLFILNDRPDIARLAEADGIHIGQDDLPVKEARRILGPDGLIGVSTHNLGQVRQAILDGASYIGVGPVFPSGTKEFEDLAGLELVRQVAGETTLPVFVIGGINPQNIGQALAAGARRVAVSQAICQAKEPRLVAAELRRMLN
jgi:thiamine-phosphate pyrophosphorylase